MSDGLSADMVAPTRSAMLQPGARATLSWATDNNERKIISTVRHPTAKERLAMLTEMAGAMGLNVSIQHFPDLSKEPT